jgi:hypothetical protein
MVSPIWRVFLPVPPLPHAHCGLVAMHCLAFSPQYMDI